MVSNLESGWRRSARTQSLLQQIAATPLAMVLSMAAVFGGPILFLSGSLAIGIGLLIKPFIAR